MLVIPDIYCNAGGVTVSYFEWLKNLSHVRFGRMQKRHEQANELAMLKAIETGDRHASSPMRSALAIAKGPDEQDLVNSGLEETMIAAFHELLKTSDRHPGVPDLRIAAFLDAHPQGRAQLHGDGDLPMMFPALIAVAFAAGVAQPTARTIIFSDDIAPIIQSRCLPCHRTNGDAPLSLATIDDVRRRASMIVAVTRNRYMPPWKPAPGVWRLPWLAPDE